MPVKITVVTPSFNQAQFLEETLRSVLSQRDQVHEYFVLDGGSTDGSADIIRRYAERGGIDYWHSRKDKGQADAIHQGFTRATGDILCWLNSDDVFLPDSLGRVRTAFEEHGDWDALTGYHVQIDAESRIIAHYRIPIDSARMLWWGVCHVAQPTCFFKKALYEEIGGIDLNLHCVLDTEMWYRMFAAGAEWGHVSEYLAGFRIHGDAKGSSWIREYASENALMDQKWPQYRRRFRHLFGLNYYRASQILSGKRFFAAMDHRRRRGRTIADVFGEWSYPKVVR